MKGLLAVGALLVFAGLVIIASQIHIYVEHRYWQPSRCSGSFKTWRRR